MKKGFTIIEVSILFVIFLIVALLVAPLSLNDTVQAKNISRWRSVQADFMNILHSVNTQVNEENADYINVFEKTINNEVKSSIPYYKITTMNGTRLAKEYELSNLKITYSNATLAYNFFENNVNGIIGLLAYDVNGTKGPNIWGKDVFGFYIYPDSLKPIGYNLSFNEQKRGCSKNGDGLSCSNYYLLGGNFD